MEEHEYDAEAEVRLMSYNLDQILLIGDTVLEILGAHHVGFTNLASASLLGNQWVPILCVASNPTDEEAAHDANGGDSGADDDGSSVIQALVAKNGVIHAALSAQGIPVDDLRGGYPYHNPNVLSGTKLWCVARVSEHINTELEKKQPKCIFPLVGVPGTKPTAAGDTKVYLPYSMRKQGMQALALALKSIPTSAVRSRDPKAIFNALQGTTVRFGTSGPKMTMYLEVPDWKQHGVEARMQPTATQLWQVLAKREPSHPRVLQYLPDNAPRLPDNLLDMLDLDSYREARQEIGSFDKWVYGESDSTPSSPSPGGSNDDLVDFVDMAEKGQPLSNTHDTTNSRGQRKRLRALASPKSPKSNGFKKHKGGDKNRKALALSP